MARDTNEKSVLGILRDAGADIDEIVRKKHVKIKWRFKGQKRTTVVPATASDHRSDLNNRALVRRQLREIESG